MKKRFGFLVCAVFYFLLVGISARTATVLGTCPQGQCYCERLGSCKFCADCSSNCPSCPAAPSKIAPFEGKKGILYILPENMAFFCSSQESETRPEIPQLIDEPTPHFSCSGKSVLPLHYREENFTSVLDTLYSIPSDMGVRCGAKLSPKRVEVKGTRKGFPTTYYTCVPNSEIHSKESPQKK